jgi:hypothetical protein
MDPKYDLLNKPIDKSISKWVYISSNISLEGNMYCTTINKNNICFIKDRNGVVLNDTVFIDNDTYIICVVPYDIAYNDFNNSKRIDIIKEMYKYICESLWNGLHKQSTIYRTLLVAPSYLTLLTLWDLDEDRVVDRYETMLVTEDYLSYLLQNSSNLEDILQYGGLLALHDDCKRMIMKQPKMEGQ